MEHYRRGIWAIMLMLALLLPCHQTCVLKVGGQESEHFWDSQITQSNSSWAILFTYQERDVFFQDEFLECTVNRTIPGALNNSLESADFELVIEHGFIGELEDYTGYYYEWRIWESNIGGHFRETRINTYVLKPAELDRNFEMTLILHILNTTGDGYTEEHVFWIIGEPEIIPPPDLNEDIAGMYIVSITVSAIAVAVAHVVINNSSRGKR